MSKVMISHSTKDQPLAQAISSLLKKCSLNQIEPWFSSDPSDGGIGAGQRWFDRVHHEMESSKAIIVLLTPNSIGSSWVQFEAGFGAARVGLELIPITVGILDKTTIPNPLSHWQIFELDEHARSVSFVQKMLVALKIYFDEELSSLAVGRYLKETEQVRRFSDPNEQTETENSSSDNYDLKRYIDQKFFELSNVFPAGEGEITSSYRVRFQNTDKVDDFTITIDGRMSLQSAMDSIYFEISSRVKSYSYLYEWIIVDETLRIPIIIKEIQSIVPAHVIFRSDHIYRIEFISSPYRVGWKANYR